MQTVKIFSISDDYRNVIAYFQVKGILEKKHFIPNYSWNDLIHTFQDTILNIKQFSKFLCIEETPILLLVRKTSVNNVENKAIRKVCNHKNDRMCGKRKVCHKVKLSTTFVELWKGVHCSKETGDTYRILMGILLKNPLGTLAGDMRISLKKILRKYILRKERGKWM